MRNKVDVKFIRRLYGTPDGNFSIFAAELVNPEDSRIIKTNKKYKNFSVSGDFFINNDELGVVHTVTIEEDYTSKYPNSYKLIKLHYELPTSAEAQWSYLKNGNIVPIGIYMSIKNTFSKNDKILDIILKDPDQLLKVSGIGETRAKLYHDKLSENQDKAAIFAEYGNIEGVGDKLIRFLVDWKPSVTDTINTIKKDPFSLLENENISFNVADKFRAHYNLPLNDRNRILHGTSYHLTQKFQDSGDTYEDIFSASKFIARKLFVNYDEVVTLLAEIQNDTKSLNKYKLKIFGRNITTQSLFMSELIIYNRTKILMDNKQHIVNPDEWKTIKENLLDTIPQELSDEQDQFLNAINNEKIKLLIGPGGAGKSWLIKLACDMIMSAGRTVGLYAPTARAAHVMTEYVGIEALTIHRGLMQYAMADSVVEEDVIIIDEYSMVDSELAAVVFKVMGENTRLIIIGDDYQLPSVGPGNVLFDLIEFIKAPTIKLTKIFRQNKNSDILNYARDLRDGDFKLPDTNKITKDDIVFINESNEVRQQEIALNLYKKAYDKYGVNDVMLLSPTNKGFSGRHVLNRKVQDIVNGGLDDNNVVFGANLEEEDKTYFKVNDYITVKKNNYQMENDYGDSTQIINGDLGFVEHVQKNQLTFRINKDPYTIEKSEVNELIEHAWAITIHKSQGGQASEVIIVLPRNSYFMLNANMLYTAITRAKVKCYIIGDFNGINSAAKEQANFNRKTMIQLQTLNNVKQ